MSTRTAFIVDNMTHNFDRRRDQPTLSTGTAINAMLTNNLKGKSSYRLGDGRTIYYKVCPIMAGNPSKEGRPINVAVVSFDPIKGEVIK